MDRGPSTDGGDVRSARAPRHRAVLATAGLVTVLTVLALQAQHLRADGSLTGTYDTVLSEAGVAWAVSLVAPAAGAIVACALGARARTSLRREGARAAHAGRTTAHVLMGAAAALAVVAVVPTLVGDPGCVEECGFTALFYAMTLGPCALLATCTGGLLLMLTGSGADGSSDRSEP